MPQKRTALRPLRLGAHLSIAGGFHRALEEAAALRVDAVQIFTRNANQWRTVPLRPEGIEAWRAARTRRPVDVMVHSSYLINLASPDPDLYRRSRTAFLEEARRCVALEIPHLVFHPGAHVGAGPEAGLDRIVKALDWTVAKLGSDDLTFLLENTAGQGTVLGARFEELAYLREHVREPDCFGVCLDTCHLLAAGYDFRTPPGYEEVFTHLDRTVGVKNVRAFHLNDSKRDLGSRVDRHEHIGEGFVGRKAFRLLLTDPRFRGLPMVLETPKAGDMDKVNLSRLRRLGRPPAIAAAPSAR
jgi:deoxyribonuclease-4